MAANTGDRRIERAILDTMTGQSAGASSSRVKSSGAGGWAIGKPEHYDRARGMDLLQLTTFLDKTRRNAESDGSLPSLETSGPALQVFLTQLQDELASRGVIDVLRHGVALKDGRQVLFYGGRSRRFTHNVFSVIPRLRYSQDDMQPPLDLCLFVNGLPIVTLELKDGTAKQTADDAIRQYARHQQSQDQLFQPGRCMAHFAVDERQAYVCAELRAEKSQFLPFNQGSSEAAGNQPSLFGIATDYLWRQTLTRPGLIDIIEHYAQMMTREDDPSGQASKAPVFPRYHQLEVVRRLLGDVESHNSGRRYLVQHAPGSGASYSMAWLVSQLLYVEQDSIRVFDTIFMVTDRSSMDQPLEDTVRRFSERSARVGLDDGAAARIHECIENRVQIILVNVEQLALVLDEIQERQRGRRFAIVIDERSSADGAALTPEVVVNRAMFARARLQNTSAFVFSPEANETTLEHFGEPFNDRGEIKYRPFHVHAS
jgi:type I restriction enzyme, R subunit